MAGIQINKILKSTADQMGLQKAFHELPPSPYSGSHLSPGEPVSYMSALNEASRPLNLTWLSKKMSLADFTEMLQTPLLPLLVFTDHPQAAVLVCSERRGALTCKTWEGEQERQLQFSTPAELASKIRNQDGQVEVWSPMEMRPLVSGPVATGKKLSPLRRLLRLLATERKDIIYIYVYAIMSGLLGMTLPLGVQSIVGQVSGGMILEPAVLLITLVIVGTLLSGLLQIMQLSLVETIQQRLFTRAAFEFAYRLPRLRLEALSKYYAPELVNRFFDILTVQKGLQKLLNDFISAGLMIIFGMLLLSLYHPLFVFFGIFMLVVLVVIFRITGPRGISTSLQESKYKYKVASWLEEVARSLTTFKMGGATQLNMEKTDYLSSQYITMRRKHFNVLRLQFSSMVVFKTLVTGALLIMGSLLVVNRQISLGQFVAAEIVIITVINGVEKIYLSLDTVYDLLTAVEKLGNVTDLEMERNEGESLKRSAQGMEVKLQNFSFTHGNEKHPTLRNISLHLKPGEHVCISGESGGGKSTLLRSLAGLYQDYEGGLVFDGISFRDLNPMQLRNSIGDNLNYEEIFEGSVMENITLGKNDISHERIAHALGVAGLTEWVNELEEGLRTPLLPRGDQLSSGRSRRIILARMLASNPRLLIIDNLNASFDPGFRDRLLGYLCGPDNQATIIAASNDPVFISRMDRVLFLDKEGRLTESRKNS
jgi:ABC-type bacteriocin/lantibiotic exporter with double-glycine peptidase domain